MILKGDRRIHHQPKNRARFEKVPGQVQQDVGRAGGVPGAPAAGGGIRQRVRERQQYEQHLGVGVSEEARKGTLRPRPFPAVPVELNRGHPPGFVAAASGFVATMSRK